MKVIRNTPNWPNAYFKIRIVSLFVFTVKFDAIQFMQTTDENLPHERASFVVREGTYTSITPLGKVT